MSTPKADLLQGTLDMLILKALSLGPLHGYGVIQDVAARTGETIGPQGVRLLAPVPQPQKVICVGLNYADHAKESGVQPPPEPVLFNKFPTAVLAPEAPIVLPAATFPGQRTKHGTRTPPSWTAPLRPRMSPL